MKNLLALKRALEKALKGFVISIMAALVLVVLWQVLSRYALNAPSSWSEELAKILLVWGSLLGASLAYAEKSHLGVDYFVGKLGSGTRRQVEKCVHALVAVGSVYMFIIGGLQIVFNAFAYGQTTPALKLCWGYIYLALPVSGVFFTIFSVEFLIEAFRGDDSATEEG
jgi:TRAP-type C4-dicarboxylate transport system permease small subunit